MPDRYAESSLLSTVWVLTARVVGVVETVTNPVTEREREYYRTAALYAPFVTLVPVMGLCPPPEVVHTGVSTTQYQPVGFLLDAYATLPGDPYYRRMTFDSLWLTMGMAPVSVGLTVLIAHAPEECNLPSEDLLVTLVLLPISPPGIVTAFIILMLFENNGVTTTVATVLTGSRPIDLVSAVNVPGLFVAFVYSVVSCATLIFHGTYVEVDSAAEEATQALDATSFETFRYVTPPQIRPSTAGALVLTFRTGLVTFGTLVVV